MLRTGSRGRTGRGPALGLFCMDLAALGPYKKDPRLIFSQYGPRAWLIRFLNQVKTTKITTMTLVWIPGLY